MQGFVDGVHLRHGLYVMPILQYSAGFGQRTKLVAMAAAMTAGVFLVMAAAARRTKADMNALGRFLMVGAVVLMVGVVANLFCTSPRCHYCCRLCDF